MLPEWLDTQMLQWVILAALGLLLVITFMILRFIRRVVFKTLLIAIIAGFGLSLWAQRTDLSECVQTCECSIYGRVVRVNYSELPKSIQDKLAAGDTTVCNGPVVAN